MTMTTASVYDSRIAAHRGTGSAITAAIMVLLGAGIVYVGIALYDDLVSAPLRSALPYILLGVALLIALGFEFVNGFHDTANAVATVIYTHSLTPHSMPSS